MKRNEINNSLVSMILLHWIDSYLQQGTHTYAFSSTLPIIYIYNVSLFSPLIMLNSINFASSLMAVYLSSRRTVET